MAGLIDTSVIIGFERRGHQDRLISVLVAGQLLALASITASELLSGVERANSLQRRQYRLAFVEAVLRIVPVIPFDLLIAREHARLDAQLRTVGQLIGANDLLFAATALTHEMSVLTEN